MEGHTPGPWIGGKGSMGQGLVYSEADGRNVAVCYDERDIPIIATAPRMFSLLGDILHQLDTDSDLETITGAIEYKALAHEISAVIGEAEGRR